MRRRLQDEGGQAVIEYALVIALVSLAAVVALSFLSSKVRGKIFDVGTAVEAAGAGVLGVGGGGGSGGAPTITSVSTSGDDNDGLVENGESLVISFSEPLNLATLCPGSSWAGGTLTTLADVKLNNSGTADYFSVDASGGVCTGNVFRFGYLAPGGDFITSNSRTFADSTISWSTATNTLTITLGGSTGAGTLLVGGSTTLTYSPHPAITDVDGVAVAGDGTSGGDTWF